MFKLSPLSGINSETVFVSSERIDMKEKKKDLPPVVLITGTDEFLAKARAREIFSEWGADAGEMDREIIEADVATQEEALKAIAKLTEALNTFPFFGSKRVVWLKDCSFLAETTVTTENVWRRLDDLAKTIKSLSWKDTRLLINAPAIDKRRSLYKAISDIGTIETYEALSTQDPDWENKAMEYVQNILEENGKRVSEDVLFEIVNRVGADTATLRSEAEKLIIYTGNRDTVRLKDVEEICSTSKQVTAFAVAEAIGKRDLPQALKRLDDEFWSMQFDKDKSEIGILYGIISKFRALLVAKDLVESRLVKPGASYAAFKNQVESSGVMSAVALKIHPFVLFKACEESKNYTREELIGAMKLLMQCNYELVSTQQDKKRVIQQTLVKILSKTA
jgi:DNA polymerase-3 subunit delta